MNGIGARIKHARKQAGLTQEALAVACGWEGNSRIGNYEAGIREPASADMNLIASALKVSAAWLWTGESAPISQPIHGVNAQPVGTNVPIVDFSTLADAAISDSFQPATMAIDWTGCTAMHGERTFAFKMPDNSMASITDNSIPAGHMVWVDPDQREVKNEDAVFVRLASGRNVVAQYMEQAGQAWVELLNHPSYLPPLGPFEIIGRVIHSGKMR